MTDVILLGAGFSKAISPMMPLIIDLSNELKSKMGGIPGNNIEHWMSYLSQSHPWLSEYENLKNRALFLQITQELKIILTQKTDDTLKQIPNCPQWLQQLLKLCHERKINIITLNYDTLVESAAQVFPIGKNSNGKDMYLSLDHIYPVPMTHAHSRKEGLYFGPDEDIKSFNIFKLHGSINWFYSGASVSTGETIYYSSVGSWDVAKRIRPSELEITQFLSDKVPLIVPPLIEKSSYFQHETIRTVWGLAGQAFRAANRLVCIGYSLPETDLSFRFFLEKNAPNPYIPLVIVNPDIGLSTHYKKTVGHCYRIDDQYLGKIIDESLVADILV